MYIRRLLPRLVGAAAVAFWGTTTSVNAQSGQPAPVPEQHQHVAQQTVDDPAPHDMGSMARKDVLSLFGRGP